jgi:DNA-binding SARP family transcriptional activator/tetratricopeptide (TPR) repeat protein
VNAELRVRLSGGLSVEGLSERDLGSRKARTLLKLLAVARGEVVAVDRAADVLWGLELPAKPAEQVGVLVSRLRGVLGADHLIHRSGGYSLAGAWLDIDEIDRRVEEASSAQSDGRLAVARAAADAALALVRGPLLPDEDGEWAAVARQRCETQVAAARRIKIEATLATGDWAAVVAQAETVLAEHPYDEFVLRMLMRAHASSGSTAAALAAYARARTRFADDLGVSPSAETEQVHTRLLLDNEAPVTAPVRPTLLDVPGRDPELARLDQLLDQVSGGRSTIVAIDGEAGIGKSTLVTAWVSGLDPSRVFVAEGRCDELGRDLPLAAVADAVAAAVRMAEPGALDGLTAEEAATLAATVGIGRASAAPTVPADAESRQGQLFGAVLRALEALAGPRPTVLVIEDLHHLAESSTLAWLGWAIHRARRLLIVVTRRTGGPVIAGENLLPLGPLDLATTRELAGEDRADVLHQRSGGHPLLLAAMISATSDDDIPSSIRDAVDRELTALDDAAATVRTAAVIGPEIDVDLLASVQRAETVGVLGDLERAAVAGLLVESEDGFRFRHELIRAGVEASMTSARRALVHREASRALAARRRSDPLAVAFHARRGGDDELAARSLVDAAERAAGRYDLDTAENLLSDAFALDADPATLVARARIRMSRLDLAGAGADAAAALEAGAGAAALEVAGWVAYYRRDYDIAGTFAEEGIAAAGDVASRAGCLVLSARVRHGAGDLAGALDRYAEAEGGQPETRQIADVWHANALLHAGRPAQALARIEHALRGPPGPHPFAPLHARWSRTLALAHIGRLADAFDSIDELDRLIERAGALGPRFIGPARNIRGYLLRNANLPDQADEANRAALEHTSGPDGDPATDAMVEAYWVAYLDLTEGRLGGGDPGGAADLLARMEPMGEWRGSMAWHQRHRLGLLQARLALADGDRERAAGLASDVAADARERGAFRYVVLADAVVALAGGSDDLDAIASTIDGLAQCAALEAWLLTAQLGRRFGVDAWTRLAGQQAADLTRAAGPHSATLKAWMSRILS